MHCLVLKGEGLIQGKMKDFEEKKIVKLKIEDKNILEIRKLFIFILGEKSNMWLIISNQIIV